MIHVWRGFHDQALTELLRISWKNNELVILVPAHLKDFSFFKKFSFYDLKFHGDWPESISNQAQDHCGNDTHPDLLKASLGVFTSGTITGVNRLIFYNKNNIEASLSSIRELFDTRRIKKIFCYPQPTHTFGLVLGYMQAILNNCEVCFSAGAYSRAAHKQWIEIADENTLTLGAPAHFLDLLQYLKSQNKDAPATYSAIVGGAKVSVDLWGRMQSELKIEAPSVGYGATEASPGVTHLPPGQRPAADGDIGYALRNVEVHVSESGLEFKGPNVCYLILENQELKKPAKILLHDSVVATPTLKGPRLTYLGRTDFMLNRGGIKISLEQVESLISQKIKVSVLGISLFDKRLGDDLGLLVQSDDLSLKQVIQDFVLAEWGFKIHETSILLGTIPLNANGKGDRVAGTKLLLKLKEWNFPVQVEHLRNLLPHKGPAIWVDEVTSIDEKFATALVRLDKSKPYYSRQNQGCIIRETACVEWVAQAYGYTVALGDIMGFRKADIALRTFIAEVKSAEFNFEADQKAFNEGDEILIKVHCTHDFGNLKVVEGQVYHQSNLLALISMKLYCGY